MENKLKHSIFVLLEGKFPKEDTPVLTTLLNEYATIPELYLESPPGDTLPGGGTSVVPGDDAYKTLKHIFTPSLLSSTKFKIYADTPSIMELLIKLRKTEEEEEYPSQEHPSPVRDFFDDLREGTLPLLSIIESNTYLDGAGWSICTEENLPYSESKILDIVKSVHSSKYVNNSSIFLLWLPHEDEPTEIIPNIWISPYFVSKKKIYDHDNIRLTSKSIGNFLETQYSCVPEQETNFQPRTADPRPVGSSIEADPRPVGDLWQKNLLNPTPIASKRLYVVEPKRVTKYMGVSPYPPGHPSRFEGSTEKLRRKLTPPSTTRMNSRKVRIRAEEEECVTPKGKVTRSGVTQSSISSSSSWVLFAFLFILYLALVSIMIWVFVKKYQ